MHNAALHFMLPDGVGSGMLDGWSSFPSDYAVLFSGLAVAVWIQSWRGGLLCAIWDLVVVCLPRVFLGYPYPTDIAAGLVIGTGRDRKSVVSGKSVSERVDHGSLCHIKKKLNYRPSRSLIQD